MRTLKSLAAALCVVILTSAATAQVPKTTDGKPDFTGVWSNASVTPLTRPASQKSLVVTEEEATRIAAGVPMAGITEEGFKGATYSDPTKGAPPKGDKAFGVLAYDSYWMDPGTKLAFVKGEWRTSFIVDPLDGQLPLIDPAAWAKKRKDFGEDYATGDVDYAGPEVPTIAERCLVFNSRAGPGMMSATYNNNYQFVQTPEYMMILVEQAHDARIVPIFATREEARNNHKPSVIKPWMGDTVGWWEGDTFVMETINVHPLQAEGHTFPLSAQAVITERFTRTSDKDIFYDFVVNDPENYTKPWKAELSFYPSSRLYEYACLEGNYSMFNLLSGARAIERRATVTKQGKSKTTNIGD